MAERIYKNRSEYESGLTLDDRRRVYSLHCDCDTCKHFCEWDLFCAAFPNGIPDEYLYEGNPHREVDVRQVGSTVYAEAAHLSESL